MNMQKRPLALCIPLCLGALSPLALAADGSDETLPDVVVTEQAPARGQASEGYRVENTVLGPLGTLKVQDTPFTINAVSAEQLENYGADRFSEAVRFLPSTYVEGHLGLEFGPPVIRGMQADDSAGSVRIDGLNVRADTALPQDLYARIEVLNGPAAALYGPAPAAGTINATLKGPTATPLRKVTLLHANNGEYGASLDLSGHGGEQDAFGYRVTLLNSNGESYVSGSHQTRLLGGVALDFRPDRDTVVEAKLSHYDFNQRGLPGGFSYSAATGLPSAPDATRKGYGQSFGGVDASTDLAEAALTRRLGGDWQLRAAVLAEQALRDFHNQITNTFTSASGDYRTSYRQSASAADVYSNYVYLNGTLYSGDISHAVSLGSSGYHAKAFSIPGVRSGSSLILGSASLDDPVSYADPGWGGTGARYRSGSVRVQSLVLSDRVGFSPRWSALLAGSDSWIYEHNWSSSGATTSTYRKNGSWSGSASLLYKPQTDATVYGTYASSVEPGASAPSGTDNENQALAPYRSKSWEFGYKTTLAHMDLGAALFRIDRPFAFTEDNVYKVAGRQRNRGLELSARGFLTQQLVVAGSLTLLDPRMQHTVSAATEDQQVMGVPRVQTNLLGEYHLASVPGLVLEEDVHHVGRRAANAENSTWAKGYTTLDVGGRYATRVGGHDLVGRLMLANVSNAHYWASINAGWSGTPGQSGTAFVGEPRTLKASVSLSL